MDSDTGAQRHMLTQSYPDYKTVHRRFQQWCEQETQDARALRCYARRWLVAHFSAWLQCMRRLLVSRGYYV